MNEYLLAADRVRKSYGKVCALDDVSIKFKADTIYGLLGRNGAGKTTLLNCLTSRIFADRGTVTAFGENAVENPRVLPRICYMPEKNLFMRNMRVRDTLRFAGGFFPSYDEEYASRLCETFELDVKKRYQALSRGYESILRIVIGLASRARVTIFDEPVLGLDAAVRDIFYREMIKDYTAHPRTFIISTHLIEESADVFEEVAIIKGGRLIEQANVEELKERALYISGRSDLVQEAASGLNVIHSETIAGSRTAAVYQPLDENLLDGMRAKGLELSPIPVQKLFIYLTNPDERGSRHE